MTVGLTKNEHGYECQHCGDEWDYRNYTTSGKIDVSELDIYRICPTLDSGFVIHVEDDAE